MTADIRAFRWRSCSPTSRVRPVGGKLTPTACGPPLPRTRALAECLPEAGEGRRATSRILHHPPVTQPVEHLRAGAGPVGCPAPDLVGADVWVLCGEQ